MYLILNYFFRFITFLYSLIFLFIIIPKNFSDISFGGDQAELYLSASKILNLKFDLVGHPSVWGFHHPGPSLRYYYYLIYLFSFGNIFLFFIWDTIFKISLIIISIIFLFRFSRTKIDWIIYSNILILSSPYSITLIKTPWAYGIILSVFFLLILAILRYRFLIVLILGNILIQVNLIFIIPFIILILTYNKKFYYLIKYKFKKVIISIFFIWILPILESIFNKGGNFQKILSIKQEIILLILSY